MAVMADGSAGLGRAAGLNNDENSDGDECDDCFHTSLFATCDAFARIVI